MILEEFDIICLLNALEDFMYYVKIYVIEKQETTPDFMRILCQGQSELIWEQQIQPSLLW